LNARLTILLIILLLPFRAVCQSLDLRQENDHLVVGNTGELQLTYLPSKTFQTLDWQTGYAYYLDGSSRQFEGMKYDPEYDLIQVNAGGNILTLLPGVINGVSMETGSVVNRIFLKVPLKESVFMEALSIGKVHLLMYRKVLDPPPKYEGGPVATIRLEKEEKIIEFEEILYYWDQGGVNKLKLSKKGVLSIMEDQEESIEKFFEDNDIRIKEPSDLMRVFHYYNSL
jgi:hypothetical protein